MCGCHTKQPYCRPLKHGATWPQFPTSSFGRDSSHLAPSLSLSSSTLVICPGKVGRSLVCELPQAAGKLGP